MRATRALSSSSRLVQRRSESAVAAAAAAAPTKSSCPEREQRRRVMSAEVQKVREAREATALTRRRLDATTHRVVSAAGPVRFAVVGGGRMGEIRCDHVARNAGARLAAFVDVSPANAAALASRHAGCEAFTALEDALAVGGVDAVWICAPTPCHLDLIAAAAERGAHVAVEKPVAMTVAEIRSAYELCSDAGVHLACAFQRRSDAAYAAVADAVARGDVGEPRSIRAVFRDHPAPPAAFLADAGGDLFHDLATHDLDFILDLVNKVGSGDKNNHPDEVWAFGTSSTPELRAKRVFDAATVVVTWKALELCATLDLARGSGYGYDQRLEVFGTSGAAVSVENAPHAHFHRADHHGLHAGKLVHSFPQRFDAAFATELDHFLDCVRGHHAPRVTHHDAVLATQVAEAAKLSAHREAPVKLFTDHQGALRLSS